MISLLLGSWTITTDGRPAISPVTHDAARSGFPTIEHVGGHRLELIPSLHDPLLL